ncbi:hypothetical protein GPECTOR_15g518 [Gonium pectorale]|uniref:Uncharacterized protein n=1 Tax=Gonium pectorale TaxID=33097 RepID=A0A150GM37_GONPE|nr:hypothetical protein GPECTOR_15g518 [Gonium pectorale]|eukprot:KXZ50832.1 hypothetical protein GPECTOR_15g518 [Gonium pectorale]
MEYCRVFLLVTVAVFVAHDLAYEFGVVTGSVYKAWQEYSLNATAVLTGLPAGMTSVYVCVRNANIKASGNSRTVQPVGPKTCDIKVLEISAQVTKEAVADQISALKDAAYKSSSVTTSSALGAVQKLAAIATVTNTTDSNGEAAANPTLSDDNFKALASGLLTQLVNVSSEVNDTASMVAVFDGVGTLWSMANASGRAAVVGGVSALSAKLASQSLTPEDAQPVMALFSLMLDSAAELVSSAVHSGMNPGGNGNGANGTAVSEATKEAARDLIASVTEAAASLVQGLLNAAPSNGSVVQISTAHLSAAVQRATAALAAIGLTLAVNTPSGSGVAATGRRLLTVSATPASISLNPTVGSLCAADFACSTDGMGLTVTNTADTALLATALGGSFTPLAAAQADYRAGSTVQVISPIVRVAAPGLPASALGLSNLVLLDIPIDTAAFNVTAKRILVRLQDYGVAPAGTSVGISPSASTTRVTSSTAALVSGTSNALGDFVVVQYVNGTDSAPGAAGPTRLPSAFLTTALVSAATLALALIA